MIASKDPSGGRHPIAEGGRGGTRADARSPKSRSILIVAPQWPHPPTWGFVMRVYQLAKELSSRHRVSLLAYGDEHAPRAAGVFEQVRLVPWPVPSQNKRWAQLTSLGRLGSHHLTGLRSMAMQSALEQMAEREAFDVVQLESSQMSFLEPVPGTCTVLDEHNIEYTLLRRLAAIESEPVRRAFGLVESLKARRDETAAWRKSSGCVFTSDVDLRQMLQASPSTPACVVPNGVDLEYFRPTSASPGEDLIVYTGSINYRPNADAVAYFIREILPKIRRARPGARLLVVGRGAPDWLTRLASEHVEFTGAVPDVRPYLARAAVAVAPIRIGSGTRIKILEAMAMARPVVTTRVGCEGLNVADQQHVLMADDADAFAECTVRLLSDRRRSAELGRAGRDLAEREFGWASAADRLERFHARLVQDKEIKSG